MVSLVSIIVLCFTNTLFNKEIAIIQPFSTALIAKILLRHRTKREFKTQNQLAVEILQEIQTPLTTHLIVVADSAFLADFVVDEIRRHPQWSFVSSLDSN